MTLHPFIAAMLDGLRDRPGLSSGTPTEARALVAGSRAALGQGFEMTSSSDIAVPTRGGSIPARLLLPPGPIRGLVIYVHGGGWVVGTIEDFDTLGRAIAHESGCAVLLPEYRLAPEHSFPSGLEDVEDAISWAEDNVTSLVGKSLPIIAAGDSSGANLVTVALRRLGKPSAVVLQVLVYPATDSNFATPSYAANSDGMPLTEGDMKWFFEQYAPEALHGGEDISPLRSNGLGVLPSTFILTAEHDVLRSDGESYALALEGSGVEVTLKQYEGMTHGFLRLHNHLDVAREALGDIAGAITRASEAAVISQ